MEIALALECPNGKEGDACGAWDYVVELHLCVPLPRMAYGFGFRVSG